MEMVVIKEFVVRYQRNVNIIRVGTVLYSNDGEHFGFRGELGLLLEIEAIKRLESAGYLIGQERYYALNRRSMREAAE